MNWRQKNESLKQKAGSLKNKQDQQISRKIC
jgi:hypothetical protein